MTQEPKHPHDRKKRHSNWGGRRTGAGARPGNMNALKHGRRSARMGKLGMIFATNPKTREMLLALADRWEPKQEKADDAGNYILAQILKRGDAASRHLSRRRWEEALPLARALPVRAMTDGLRREISMDRSRAYYRSSVDQDSPPAATHRPTHGKNQITRRSIKMHERTRPVEQDSVRKTELDRPPLAPSSGLLP